MSRDTEGLQSSHARHDHSHHRDDTHGDASSSNAPRAFQEVEGLVPGRVLERGAGRDATLFFDCLSGTAGDMTVAALLDLGVPVSVLEEAVAALRLNGVRLLVQRGLVGALGATRFEVVVEAAQSERTYAQIVRLIEDSSLDEAVKGRALGAFRRLGEAEAAVHRTALEHVHFHEVGAVDAIVDIVGAAAAFEFLGARAVASPVPLGRGFVQSRHGPLPLPAPATLLCLRGFETRDAGLEVELVTPTGAALLAEFCDGSAHWPGFTPLEVGYGAGTRVLPDRPNVLRLVLGTSGPASKMHPVSLLEMNLDDMTAETVAFALEQVLRVGALDAWLTPITMKKSRPGWTFSVLARPEQVPEVLRLLLRETSTLGVRQSTWYRHELERRVEILESEWGPVSFKVGEGDAPKFKPELEDAARIARSTGLPLVIVLQRLTRLAHERLGTLG